LHTSRLHRGGSLNSLHNVCMFTTHSRYAANVFIKC
jgi:hypothetical protein